MKKNKLEGLSAPAPEVDSAHDKEMDKYEIDNHVRTLMDAEKIKGDEKLMKALHPHIEKYKEAASKLGDGPIKSIEQLKEKAKQKLSEPD